MKRLLLLGGGLAHLQVLGAFAQQPVASAQATLVVPQRDLIHATMLPAWVAGHYSATACRVPLGGRTAHAHVQLHEGRVAGLDATARRVRLADGGELAYDVLSIDGGAGIERDTIPGAREHALFLHPLDAFMPLWERVRVLAETRHLCVVVIGGGAVAAELALAVAHRLGEQARVSLVTGGLPPLPGYPPGLQRRIARALKALRITVFEDRCTAIEAQQLQLERGARVACDAPLIASDAVVPDWLRGSGLALDEAGFVASGPTLQSPSHPEVFATGDIAARGGELPPRNAAEALRAGAALALNLRRFIGGGPLEPYRARRRTLEFLACGDRRAIARWGDWSVEGRWVWRWKDRTERRFVSEHGGLN